MTGLERIHLSTIVLLQSDVEGATTPSPLANSMRKKQLLLKAAKRSARSKGGRSRSDRKKRMQQSNRKLAAIQQMAESRKTNDIQKVKAKAVERSKRIAAKPLNAHAGK